VLRQPASRLRALPFAAGLAAALLLFALGFMSGPLWRTAEPPVSSGPTDPLAKHDIQEMLAALERRTLALENQEVPESLSPGEMRSALADLERRFRQERARDLEYLTRTLTASELRTGSWIDRTEDALTLLALQQDPRLAEQ
jgi:hypothetical protein